MNILIWTQAEGKGPFQRQLADGRVLSDMVTTKPFFSFPYVDLRYVEQTGEFKIDGYAMSEAQKAEVLSAIQAVEIPLDWYKMHKTQAIMAAYQATVTAIAGQVEPVEMTSWTKQEAQARAYLADNQAVTPMLDGLLLGRNMGETKLQLAQKIVMNADGYQAAYSTVLGMYQSRMKTLAEATTVEAVEAITV